MDEDNETVLLDLVEPGQAPRLPARRRWRLRQRPLQELDQPLADPQDEGWPGHERGLAAAEADRRCRLVACPTPASRPSCRGTPAPVRRSRLPVHDLKPQLGVVYVDGEEFVMATCPG